ncbi:MAG: EAL domain-containing protein [Legionellaceae bacterium]|nr:EAL domain-containing protein [Legionellaceae bacterium]
MKSITIKVLYLEDDPLDIELAKQKLEDTDLFQVDLVFVSNEDDFKKELSKNKFDIFLSDYNLPSYTGLDALKYLIKNKYNSPFILVSGAIGDEPAVEIMKLGAFDYVLKDQLDKLPLVIKRAKDNYDANIAGALWESMFHSIEKASLAGFFKLDPNGKYDYTNKYFLNMLFETKKNIIGKPWFNYFGSSNKSILKEKWLKNTKKNDKFVTTINIDCAQNKKIWLNINIVPEISNSIIKSYVGVVFDVTNIKETEGKLEHIKKYDTVTQLLNINGFEELLEASIKESSVTNTRLTILLVDILDFKKIGDAHGSHTGDNLIIEVSKLLKEQFGEKIVIAKINNDSFALLLRDLSRASSISFALNSLSEKIKNKPIEINKQKFFIKLSTGIAQFPEAGNSAKEIMQHAGQALSHAKHSEQMDYYFYTERLNKDVTRISNIEHALHSALDTSEIYICYQPQVDILTNKVVGLEALCRWKSKTLGEVSPYELIPVAEGTGLILPLTKYIYSRFLFEMEGWLIDFPDLTSDINVSINLSASILSDPSLLPYILSESERYNLSFEKVCFEITETAIMENKEKVSIFLDNLSRLNFKLSIDDFGTGQSSLSYLKSLPVHELKIDASFIKNIHINNNEKMIVDAVIRLAHSLNLLVVAEGVEYIEQLNVLKELKCDLIQGYYFSKPLRQEELIKFLEDFNNRSGNE